MSTLRQSSVLIQRPKTGETWDFMRFEFPLRIAAATSHLSSVPFVPISLSQLVLALGLSHHNIQHIKWHINININTIYNNKSKSVWCGLCPDYPFAQDIPRRLCVIVSEKWSDEFDWCVWIIIVFRPKPYSDMLFEVEWWKWGFVKCFTIHIQFTKKYVFIKMYNCVSVYTLEDKFLG